MSGLRVMRVIARMNVGGPALQITGLTAAFESMGIDHRLYAGDVGPGEEDYLRLRAEQVAVYRVPGLGRDPRPYADLLALRHLVRAMGEYRPDIVHTHTAKAGVLGRVAARLAGVPHTVHTFHGHLLHGYFPPPVTWAVTAVEARFARSTDRLVAVGEQVRDDLLAAGVGRPDQYVVFPPGVAVEPGPAREAARADLGIGPDAEVVCFVARLTGVKRPDRLVAVAQLLSKARPGAVVLVVGGGPLLEQTQQQAAAAGLAGTMRFLGWRADVARIYAAGDVALLCSDNEGTPVSLIEAALSGLPAVAPAVGSVGEVVEHGRTGLVVAPDVPALAAAVLQLLEDAGLRRRMGEAAARRAGLRYGVARLAADHIELYEEILRAR